MTRDIATVVIIALAIFPVLLWLGKKNLHRDLPLTLLFILAMLLDVFLSTLPLHVKALLWFENRFDWQGIVYSNWEGKAYSSLMALTLMLALAKRFTREQFGLTLRHKPESVRPAIILGVVLLPPVTLLAFLAGRGPFDGSLLLYLLLMPALSEELVFRGLLLGMADAIAPPRWIFCGAPVGWGLILVTFIFGLLHGFSIETGWRIRVDFAAVLLTGGYGFAYGWMRERTGSLLIPMLFHGMTDFFQFFWRMV